MATEKNNKNNKIGIQRIIDVAPNKAYVRQD